MGFCREAGFADRVAAGLVVKSAQRNIVQDRVCLSSDKVVPRRQGDSCGAFELGSSLATTMRDRLNTDCSMAGRGVEGSKGYVNEMNPGDQDHPWNKRQCLGEVALRRRTRVGDRPTDLIDHPGQK